MAYFVRITAYSRATSAVVLQLEPPWWPGRELRADPRFRPSDGGSGYLDYEADLPLEEARALHERFRPRATEGAYAYDGWQQIIQPMLRSLDDALGGGAAEMARFHVSVCEWESGLE